MLAVEKRLTSPLLEPASVEKIFEVDSHVGCAISGLTADARTLVDFGRVECQSHRFTYDEPLRVESLTQALCDLAMSFAEEREEDEEGERKPKMSRPFGVSLLIAGTDARGPQLLHMDPSGTYIVYDAHAIGSGSEGAITQLVEKYSKAMTLEQGKALVTRVLAVRWLGSAQQRLNSPGGPAPSHSTPPRLPFRRPRRTRWRRSSPPPTLSWPR